MFDLNRAMAYNGMMGDAEKFSNLPEKFRFFAFESPEFSIIVLSFQNEYNDLVKDGMCGPKTINKMILQNDSLATIKLIEGKGFFLWKSSHAIPEYTNKNDLKNKIEQWAKILWSGNIKYILIKTADGRSRHNSDTLELISKILPDYGISVYPWVYSWNYEDPSKIQTQVDIHNRTYEILGSPGIFVVNAEKGMKKERDGKTIPDYKKQAAEYMKKLKALTGATIYLSSYGFVKSHVSIYPFEEMVEGCDIISPQCYASAKGYHKNPEKCLERSEKIEWRKFNNQKKPIMPSLGCWQKRENGIWLNSWHNEKQIVKAMDWLKTNNKSCSTFWLWLKPGKKFGNIKFSERQWEAIKTYDW